MAEHVNEAVFTKQLVEPLAVPALQKGSTAAGDAGVQRKGADVEVANEEDSFACCLAGLHAQLQGLQVGSDVSRHADRGASCWWCKRHSGMCCSGRACCCC